MNKRIILLMSAVFFQIHIAAQDIADLTRLDLTVKNILPPLNPIPDSLTSYQLFVDLVVPPAYSSIDEQKVKNAFQLPSFSLKSNGADMLLFVSVQKLVPTSPKSMAIREEKDKKEYLYFWIEEVITPIISTVLVSKTGDTLFRANQGISLTYATARSSTEEEARKLYNNHLKDPNYEKTISDAYFQSLKAIASDLKQDIDWEDANISLYYVSGEGASTANTLRSVSKALQRLTKNNQDAIKKEITPFITSLEKTAALPYTKKERNRYYASVLSLINIHRMLNNLERASYYNQLLINEDYFSCKSITAQLASQKERTTRYLSYQKTGTDPYTARRNAQAQRVSALNKTGRSEGYIVLANNEIIRGEILDLIPNFNRFIVKIKYEKTLNDPIEHKQYPLADVKEIHTEHAVWMVVPDINQFYPCEVIAQSPYLTLVESLPGVLKDNNSYAQFIRKGAEEWAFVFLNSERAKAFSSKLRDCPDIAKRAEYGYYTILQTQDAISDYDQLCGATLARDSVFTAKLKRSPNNNKKMGRTPGFTYGFSTGSNNFVSYFGINTSFRIVHKLYGRAGAGIGEWGPKYAAGIRYDLRRDMRYRKSWSFSAGYTYNAGRQKTLTFDNVSPSMPQSDSVQIRPLATRAVFASVIFTKYFNKRVSTHLEMGYSHTLDEQPWDIISGNIDGPRFRRDIHFKQPGGIIFAAGINFGF